MKIYLLFCIAFCACLPSAHAADLATGKPVPAFEIKTLAGQSITPASVKGRVLVINLWATWCPPCRKEMPAIEEFYRQHHGQGLDVVAVSLDDRSDIEAVKQAMQPFSFPAALEKDADLQRFGRIWRVPVTFVIDRNGILRHNGWEGDPLVDMAVLEKTVAPLLAPLPANN